VARSKKQVRARSAGYIKYLKSAAWGRLRSSIIKADTVCASCKCMASKNNPLDLHHLTYERFGAELPDDLEVVCRKCHDLIHKLAKAKRYVPLPIATAMVIEETSMHCVADRVADAEAVEWLKYRPGSRYRSA
jgi:hypothetical protein